MINFIEHTELNPKKETDYCSVLPLSVLNLSHSKKDKIRTGGENYNKQSSRDSFSCFPENVNELCYDFYLKNSKNIFDPFAGWGERSKKAKEKNKNYFGYDISPLAIEYAEKNFNVKNNLGNSLTDEIPLHDGLITCPPYWNLEKYEGEGLQKNKTWNDFLTSYKKIYSRCLEKSTDQATYCIMVGDWRSKGIYYNLSFETEKIMLELGMKTFDKLIVSRANNTKIKILLPQAKKLGYSVKVHEYLFIFKK